MIPEERTICSDIESATSQRNNSDQEDQENREDQKDAQIVKIQQEFYLLPKQLEKDAEFKLNQDICSFVSHKGVLQTIQISPQETGNGGIFILTSENEVICEIYLDGFDHRIIQKLRGLILNTTAFYFFGVNSGTGEGINLVIAEIQKVKNDEKARPIKSITIFANFPITRKTLIIETNKITVFIEKLIDKNYRKTEKSLTLSGFKFDDESLLNIAKSTKNCDLQFGMCDFSLNYCRYKSEIRQNYTSKVTFVDGSFKDQSEIYK